MGVIITNDYLDEVLVGQAVGSASAAHGALYSCSIGCTSAALALSRTTTLAQMTAIECSFPGYARAVVAWNTPTRGPGGLMESLGTVAPFQPSGSTSPQNAYAIFGVLASGSLGFCGSLDNAPVPLPDQFSILIVNPAFQPVTGGNVTNLP